MELIKAELIKSNGDGTRKVRVDLGSTNIPATFPTTGDGIDGLGINDILAPMSTFYVVNGAKVYMADEDMNWLEQ